MLVPVYTEEVYIDSHFLDELGHVNNTWHVHWMQDVATKHSALNGWDSQRYLDFGACWFVRQHTVNYLRQIREGDTVLVETWVSEMKHVTSIRQYRFLRKADGVVLAEAQTRWGLVDLKTGRPRKAPQEMLNSFLEVAN